MHRIFGTLVLLVGLTACGPEPRGPGGPGGDDGGGGKIERVCTPGATQSCVCPGGSSGAQSCNSDGTGWNVCQCESTGGSKDRVCAPGVSQSCACTGGGTGAQTCNADGQGFGTCVCSGGSCFPVGARCDGVTPCCSGSTCTNIPGIGNVCTAYCSSGPECVSGCCKPLTLGGSACVLDLYCADRTDCTAAVGTACTGDASCCDDASGLPSICSCIGEDCTCKALCSSNAGCVSGCCRPRADGILHCVPSFFCQ